MKNIAFVLSLSLLLLTSCSKKDDATSTNEPTPTQTLIASTWKRSEYKEAGVVKAFWASCQMDDKLVFKADGNYIFTDDGVTCTNSYGGSDFFLVLPDNVTMRWGGFGEGTLSFNSNKTSFTFKGTGNGLQQEFIYVKY